MMFIEAVAMFSPLTVSTLRKHRFSSEDRNVYLPP